MSDDSTPSATALGQASYARVEYDGREQIVEAHKIDMRTDELQIALLRSTPVGVGALTDWIPRSDVVEIVDESEVPA